MRMQASRSPTKGRNHLRTVDVSAVEKSVVSFVPETVVGRTLFGKYVTLFITNEARLSSECLKNLVFHIQNTVFTE